MMEHVKYARKHNNMRVPAHENEELFQDLLETVTAFQALVSTKPIVSPTKKTSTCSTTSTTPTTVSSPSPSSSPELSSSPESESQYPVYPTSPAYQQTDTRRFNDKKWTAQFRHLQQFKREFGHCFVPHTFPPNPFLARWVKRQRRQYKLMLEGKRSTMTPERVQLLSDTGFVWDSHEAIWRHRLDQVCKYKEMHGHCLIPSGYSEDPALATWVKCQRRQFKLYGEGKSCGITSERIKLLEKIGFEWELRPSPSKRSSSSIVVSRRKGSGMLMNGNTDDLRVESTSNGMVEHSYSMLIEKALATFQKGSSSMVES